MLTPRLEVLDKGLGKVLDKKLGIVAGVTAPKKAGGATGIQRLSDVARGL